MLRATTILLLFGSGCAPRAEDGPGTAEAPRIVSVHDVTTEVVVALGAGDRLVGMTELVDATTDIARAVEAVPRVASLESIVAQDPDIVVGLGVVQERAPELVARLRERDVDVLLADPGTLEEVYALVASIAHRLGEARAGKQLVDRMRTRIAASTTGLPLTSSPPRVFVYDCCDPPFTAGGRALMSDLIVRAGGRNVFSDLDADWTHVSWEEVVERRPELIVIHAYPYEGQGDVAQKRRALSDVPTLADIPTIELPLGCALGGLRSAEGVERLQAAIGARS